MYVEVLPGSTIDLMTDSTVVISCSNYDLHFRISIMDLEHRICKDGLKRR